MSRQSLKYAGNEFIKQDLRRLKSIKSLEVDLEAVFNLIQGLVEETTWPPPLDFCGGLIAEFDIDGERFTCFKDRVPTVNPRLTPSNGCRLIYALGSNSRTFIPLLVYRANEEGKMYLINGKKLSLTSGNLGKIINHLNSRTKRNLR